MRQSNVLPLDLTGLDFTQRAETGAQGGGRRGWSAWAWSPPSAAYLASCWRLVGAVEACCRTTQLSLSVARHTVTVHNLHQRLISDGALVFLILPSALWIEYAFVGWETSSIRGLLFDRTASMKTDLAVFVLGQGHILDIVGRILLLGASMISGLWIRGWLTATFGLTINPPALPMPLEVVLFFFVYTFFDYWTHRLDHTHLFWPLHRYHHSAEEFYVLTSTRQHPAALTPIFLINIPMAVLGAPADVMIWVNVIVVAIGFLIHSRIDSTWGWVGRWLIQSPNHHRLHHKLDMTTPTGHFAMAPVWDRLFGTWYGDADQTLAIGVSRQYRQGFWIAPDMLRDYADLWLGVFGRRKPE